MGVLCLIEFLFSVSFLGENVRLDLVLCGCSFLEFVLFVFLGDGDGLVVVWSQMCDLCALFCLRFGGEGSYFLLVNFILLMGSPLLNKQMVASMSL